MLITKSGMEQLKNTAITMLAQGTNGVWGISRNPIDNKLYVITKKSRELIVKLNIKMHYGNKTYTWNETNLNQQLVLGKGDNDENPAWFFLCDKDWNYITSSHDDEIDFQMILFAQPRKRLPHEGRDENWEKNKNIPISINARFSSMKFDSQFAVVASIQDQNIARLWEYEADNILGFTVNNNKEDEQHGQPQFDY